MNKAIFLDRDGVINPLVYNIATGEYESPHRPDDFSVYPWTVKALRRLKSAGFYIFIISNQPSFAKGKTSFENIRKTEELCRGFFEENGGLIDKDYYCLHHPEGIVPEYSGFCRCRKPGTLFIEQAAKEFNLDLSACFFIGDQDSDIRCGKSAGIRTIKINNVHSAAKSGRETPDAFADNLHGAAEAIISIITGMGNFEYER